MSEAEPSRAGSLKDWAVALAVVTILDLCPLVLWAPEASAAAAEEEEVSAVASRASRAEVVDAVASVAALVAVVVVAAASEVVRETATGLPAELLLVPDSTAGTASVTAAVTVIVIVTAVIVVIVVVTVVIVVVIVVVTEVTEEVIVATEGLVGMTEMAVVRKATDTAVTVTAADLESVMAADERAATWNPSADAKVGIVTETATLTDLVTMTVAESVDMRAGATKILVSCDDTENLKPLQMGFSVGCRSYSSVYTLLFPPVHSPRVSAGLAHSSVAVQTLSF